MAISTPSPRMASGSMRKLSCAASSFSVAGDSAQHRQRAVEHLGRDQRAEGRTSSASEKISAAGALPVSARSSTTPDPEHDPRLVGIISTVPAMLGPMLRVMRVDDARRVRIDPAPEAEPFGQRQHAALRGTGQDIEGHVAHLTTKPCAKGSRSSMKMVL